MSSSQGVVIASDQSAVSVTGQVGASIIGLTPVNVSNFPTNQNVSGSVAALQGGAWTASVVGTVGASIIGLTPVNVSNTNLNVSGSVAAFQGGAWTHSVVGTVGASLIGVSPVTLTANTVPASALAFLGVTASVIGSTVTVTGYPQTVLQITANPSMTGVINFQGTADGSSWRPIQGYNQETGAISSFTTVADTNWSFNTAGLQAFRANIGTWTAGSITGKAYLSPADARPYTTNIGNSSVQVLNFPTTQNVSGSVAAFQGGAWTHSVVGTVGASIIGLTPVTVSNTNLNVAGSVVAFQGTTPWIIGSIYGNISGSVAATIQGTPNVNTAGSVVAFQGTSPWVIGSIAGTYAEDATSIDSVSGLYVLGVRNDTIASTTSADKDWSQFSTDSAGRTLVKPFVSDDGTLIEYFGSVVSTSVTAIKTAATGKRNYVTDFWIANTGSVATLLTWKDGSTSILGFTIAPAGGGSNSQGINLPFKSAASQDLTFSATTNVSVLYVTVRGYQAP